MRYLDGGWLIQPGYQVSHATEVYDWRLGETADGRPCLFVYEPFRAIPHAGMTLDGGLLTTEITAPLEGVFEMRHYHHLGGVVEKPAFETAVDPEAPLALTVTETALELCSGRARLVIGRDAPALWRFYYDGEERTKLDGRSRAWVVDAAGCSWISTRVGLGVGEQVYGFGERFSAFVKNGQSIDTWNRDGGTGTTQAYKCIPFYLTNRGYGVFVSDPGNVEFEVASEKVSDVQFAVRGEELRWCWIPAEDMAGVLDRYTALTGRAPLLPDWSYGLWLSTSFLTDYDEATVLAFVDGMQARGIPLSVFHFDCLWMKPYEWCSFLWDEDKFPDPAGLLARLHERGLKISLWINPYVGQKSPLFAEGRAAGYFLKRPDGSVWQWDRWQAGMAVVDFTNPEAVEWYLGHLDRLMDMGVDSFKTDFGERIPTDVVYHDGSDPVRMHNYYSFLYNRLVFERVEARRGRGEAVLFARAASAGSQRFPVHWGGDNSADYESMAESLRAGLSFGLSGFAYWSHDIGGFEDDCDPDLYRRWTQFGLLSSHSRYHGSHAYKVPWLYGELAVENTRIYTELKLRLLPYLRRAGKEANERGLPLMRAMVLSFPEDPNCLWLDRQYMLGPDLLVAPVFSPDGGVAVYLPDCGDWTRIDARGDAIAVEAGGRWLQLACAELEMPLFIRPGAPSPFAD
ncbi:MAG: alpha-xylosidase [Bacillota bacterium]|nr:alpha-xylosidase [Bacillota bacterium]